MPVAMTTYIALLRAVNLGPHNKVPMTALRECVGTLGMEDVRTLLQSGNVVFRGRTQSPRKLEAALVDAIAGATGVRTPTFVRTRDQWREMIAANPFVAEATRTPQRLLVFVLAAAPASGAAAALQQAVKGPERVAVAGLHLFALFPEGVGRSKLTSAVIERALGTVATGRNWNTVSKLAALADVAAAR
jgi:uncharacterized protein (DUF1697 family)